MAAEIWTAGASPSSSLPASRGARNPGQFAVRARAAVNVVARRTSGCVWLRPARNRKLQVVAASPPAEEVAIGAEPLTKKDLVDYIASGCKPKERWR